MQYKRITQLILIAVLVLSAFGFAAPQGDAFAKAQPLLAEMAAEVPDQLVRVIAQKVAGTQDAETLVAELGGQVVSDLSIINAFAAEMTAEAALELAQADGVRWVSLDAPVESAGGKPPKDEPTTTDPENTYLDTMGVYDLWDMGLTGAGIGVAIVDSGIAEEEGWNIEVITQKFATNSRSDKDIYGHGTHVAGIVAGNGSDSNGMYRGIAPGVKLISIKVADGDGLAYESDVVAGLQWVYENHTAYNIRVVNISLNTTTEQSYHVSPLDAAVEILWFNGIVVVASAGNYWDENSSFNPVQASPANDPFIITVGAIDEKGTTRTRDDNWANFSAIGNTTDGFHKPDIHAPGKDIVSLLSRSSPWGEQYPERVTANGEYIRLSGTSMSAPMVTGVVALLLEDEPNLTPDQVKYRLINTSYWAGTVKSLDAYKAVTGNTTESANQGLYPSQLLATGDDPIAWGSVGWNSVGWNSVGWNSVGWNSVGWNSVGWNSVGWNSTFWGE